MIVSGLSRAGQLRWRITGYAVLCLLLVVFLLPLLWIIGISFKTRIQVFSVPPLLIWKPTLQNYISVVTRGDFLVAFVNSLVISTASVLLSLVVGVPAAYAFARIRFRGRAAFFFSLPSSVITLPRNLPTPFKAPTGMRKTSSNRPLMVLRNSSMFST